MQFPFLSQEQGELGNLLNINRQHHNPQAPGRAKIRNKKYQAHRRSTHHIIIIILLQVGMRNNPSYCFLFSLPRDFWVRFVSIPELRVGSCLCVVSQPDRRPPIALSVLVVDS